MKKYLLLITLIITIKVSFSQEPKITEFTDIDIANALIGIKADIFEGIFQRFDIEYWVTHNSDGKIEIYISYDQSVRSWKLYVGSVTREISGQTTTVAKDVIKEIFVRYRHSNLNDLKSFYSYEIPQNEKHRTFEKQLGSDVSHLRITQL